MTYQLVKHIPSGEVYAVKFDADGSIYMSEPLHHSEQDADLDDYEYNEPAGAVNEQYDGNEWQVVREA